MRPVRTLLPALVLLCGLVVPASAHAPDPQVNRSQLGAPDFDLPAVQLRIGLGRVLGEHAMLLIETMRAGLADDDQFAAAAATLEENTSDLLTMVEAAYGEGAVDAFGEQWRNHIAYLVDYTRAVADGDEDARQLATDQLDAYIADFSSLLAAANPSLEENVIEELIAEHGQQLSQIGHFDTGEHEAAYRGIRETYAHMYMVGDALTLGILDRARDEFPGRPVAFSRALDMRVTLDRLLGEHTMLAAFVMRSRLSNAPDVQAAADALEANSAELASQIEAIYGEDAGNAFGTLWRSHTGHYIDFVDSVATDDAAARETAVTGLRDYQTAFSEFLAGANPFLSARTLEGMLETHTTHLVDLVDQFDDGSVEDAYATLRMAYAHTEELAAGLAGAIADQFPERFSDTAVVSQPAEPTGITVGVLLVVAAALLLTRRAVTHRRRSTFRT